MIKTSITNSQNLSSSSTSTVSSQSSKLVVQSNKNFIEKNKKLIQTYNKNSNQEKSDIIIKCLNDIDTNKPILNTKIKIKQQEQDDNKNEKDENNHEVDISIISVQSSIINENINSNNNSYKLVQGDQLNEELDESPVRDKFIIENKEKNFVEDDVNISEFDQYDKSKIRSQFMQRFGTSQAKKREIIPTIIDSAYESTTDSLRQTLSQNNQECLNSASITAALNVVTQPIVKLQSDLENKITNVLKHLEILRQNEDNLVPKLIEKRNLKKLPSTSLSSSSSLQPHQLDEEDLTSESDARLKHLEMIQENQFKLMSQLIDKIGQENKISDLTKTYEITEPKIRSGTNENFVIKTRSKSKSNSKSRSRSRVSFEDESKTNGHKSRIRVKSGGHSSCESCDRSKSRRRTLNNKKQSLKLRHRSKSPDCSHINDTLFEFDPVHGCLQCYFDKNENKEHKKNKNQFLENLLENAPKSPLKSSLKMGHEHIEDDNSPTLFDKYLTEAKHLINKIESSDDLIQKKNFNSNLDPILDKNLSDVSDILKSSNQLLTELEREQEKQLNSKSASFTPQKRQSSMFSDIKQVLKQVEQSKSQIDIKLDELNRARNSKMFYLLNTVENEDDEKIRIKKLVDGCINAISTDVQKLVSQKLIDDSKHVRLEAERDIQNKLGKKVSRQVATKSNELNQKSKAKLGTNISNVHKYLGKIYGKGLLEQIKLEELEEKNRQLKHEQEIKKQIETEKRLLKLKPQQKKDEIKQINKPNEKPQIKLQIDSQRPAFSTKPFEAYPENRLKSFTNLTTLNNQPKTSNDNIAMVTITPRDTSPPKNLKTQIIKQNLPSLSINPTSNDSNTKRVNFKHVDIKSEDLNTSKQVLNEPEQINEDDTGTGININGVNKQQIPSIPPLNLYDELNQPTQSQLSSETADFLRQRNIYENRVLDWLEQEILKNFLNRLQIENENNETESESDDSNHIKQYTYPLLIDMGEPIDPNLINSLIYEVLEEKIKSMINNYYPVEDEMIEIEPKKQHPLPSPRKTIEYLEQQKEKQPGIEINTPIVTPTQSAPSSPKIEKQPSKKNEQIQTDLIFQFIQQEDDEESVLEVTLDADDFDDDKQEITVNTKSIVIPPTPKETPNQTPEPPHTPDISINEPPRLPTPPPVPVIIKNLVTTSVQCDPVPEPVIKPIQIISEPPKPIVQIKQDISSDITESSSYTTTDVSSSTLNSEDVIEEEQSDSYFSDGVWLMSKSEGEIVYHNHNNYVNLDLEQATRGMMLNPKKEIKKDQYISESEGEIKIENLGEKNFYGGQKKTGVNLISQTRESGEVKLLKQSSEKSEKSEGEVDNPAVEIMNKKMSDNLNLKLKKDKKEVNLKLSPNKVSKTKNKIKIQAIPNEILVRDSNDFERKIYSSTPDTSMLINGTVNLASSNQILAFNDHYDTDNDENDEQELSIHIDDEHENDKTPKIIKRKNLQVSSTDLNSYKFDDDDNTLN